MDYAARVKRIHRFAAQVSHQSEITLFVDNIGPDCAKSQVLQWLDSHGFQDTYDYLYVPRCFHTRKSTGQMFINFFVMDVVDAFTEAVKAATFGTDRVLRVQLSTTQGLEANMSRWVRARSRRIRDTEVLPYVRPLDGSGVAHPAEAMPEAALAPKCGEVPMPSAWAFPPGAPPRAPPLGEWKADSSAASSVSSVSGTSTAASSSSLTTGSGRQDWVVMHRFLL